MVGFHGLGIFNNRKAFEIDVEQNWRKTRDLDKLDETQKGTKSKAESSEARDRKEKVPGLGWGMEPKGRLLREAGKAGCFVAKVLIMRNFLMILSPEGGT